MADRQGNTLVGGATQACVDVASGGRGRGRRLFAVVGLLALLAACRPTGATNGAPTTSLGGSGGSGKGGSSQGGGLGSTDFCALLADQAAELASRIGANPKAATDPEFQAFAARTNSEIMDSAPSELEADVRTVFGVAEAVRKAAAEGGDVSEAAAAANTPEFQAATTHYTAWVKKNCSAEQASLILSGLGG